VSALALSLALLSAGPAGVQTLGPPPPAKVRRVVTLAPSLTETVIALGAGERLVGVSRFDDLPEVKALPRVGGFVDPSLEAVLAVHPDLVLVQPSPGNRQAVEKLASFGISVLSFRMQSIEDVLDAVRAAGKALGRAEQGEALAKEIESTRAEIRKKASGLPHPRVLFIYGFDPLVVAGPGSFANELVADAGGRNVAADVGSPYPVYSVEKALKDAPDVVIDASGSMPGGKLRKLPGLDSARWVRPTSEALLHPGPRLAEGLRQLFGLIHPQSK
jgi:iron complex transport system substrate-binding protein